MLAKIGSDMNKPNGQTFIPPDREVILNFLKDLPIRKVSMSALLIIVIPGISGFTTD